MKRLLITLVAVFSFVVLSTTAHAFETWKVTISSPANTTSKTFNVQYTASSVYADDDFTLELFQNGSSIGSQTVTTPRGDSGVFPVTVPTVGTYSYFIEATNSNDETPKNTSSVSVTVNDPPAGTVTTVFVNSGTNTGTTGPQAGGQGGGAVANGGGAVAQAGGAGTAGATGGGAGAGGAPTGQIGDQTATTETPNDDGSVLGSETKKEEAKNVASADKNSTNPLWYVLGLSALSAIGYAAYTMRARAINKE